MPTQPRTDLSFPSRAVRRVFAGAALGLTLLITACATAPGGPQAPVVLGGGTGSPVPPVEGGASSPVGVQPTPPVGVEPTPPVVVVPPTPPKPPRIGLALGGGAARGFAHIGVIQVLEENGIRPDLVVGTSAGSLVAALYASGHNGQALAKLADTMDEATITDWSFPLRGVIRGEALARYVRTQTGSRTIEQMKMPLGIVATDLDDGSGILFRRGDAGTAVRASSSVPAVFQPVSIGGREYVDGGLVAPVPVRYARQMGADLVIAVDISSPPEGAATGDAMKMLLQTFSIMGRSINSFELKEADIVLRPKLTGISSADFSARKRSIQAGRDIALGMLAELKNRILAKTR
ncbi:patatin-like phospholipase family protein [Leptothrix discophora]|uniref:Patatin-like phospholipase family protein n=1 Tax=Leptothrix discophora TaxID=89 RepID=A0ABT9FXR3_LEPDI|nr:patatin-like phospholipase family protein [Leptothrix discophora]MDP4299023.1 patatin-like phospholipase family protein [Leptothrix discophora]